MEEADLNKWLTYRRQRGDLDSYMLKDNSKLLKKLPKSSEEY